MDTLFIAEILAEASRDALLTAEQQELISYRLNMALEDMEPAFENHNGYEFLSAANAR